MATDLPDWTATAALHALALGTVDIASLASSGSNTFSPTLMATCLRLYVVPSGTGAPLVTVTGNDGYVYYNHQFSNAGSDTGGPVFINIPGDHNNPVTVAISNAPNQGVQSVPAVYVDELDGMGMTGVFVPSGDSLPVQGVQGSDAAGIQVLPDPPGGIWAGYETAAKASFIVGTSGKTLRLRTATLQFTASGSFAVALQSDGTAIVVYETFPQSTVTNEGPFSLDWNGFALPVGEGLSLEGTSGVRMSGFITYDLY